MKKLPKGWKDVDIANYPQYQSPEQLKAVLPIELTNKIDWKATKRDEKPIEQLLEKMGIPIISEEDLIEWIEARGKYAKN